MTIRERTEQIEKQILSPRGALSAQSRGRQRPEEQHFSENRPSGTLLQARIPFP